MRATTRNFLSIAAAGLLACTGDIGSMPPGGGPGASADPAAPWAGGTRLDENGNPIPGTGPGGEEGPGNVPGAGDGPGAGGASAGDDDDPSLPPVVPAPATRAARLTHTQWENSVGDLLRLTSAERQSGDFASGLLADPVQSGFLFDNNSLSLEVSEALFLAYQRAAADIAAFVVGDATRLAKILPPDNPDSAARARQLVEELGLRAHRRPLTSEQIDAYLSLHAMGAALYPGGDAFEAGVRVLIEAFLQSPHFLYRIEPSAQVEGDRIALDSYEIATRLSYTLWNTMPDDALFDAAASDLLADADEAALQARRMLDDPRAEDTVYSFHRQLFEADDFESISPAPAFFPDVSDQLGELARTEHELFTRDVFSSDGGFLDLLTSSETFVNAELAEIYGLAGDYGASFERASLDPAQRKGILTQVGFLASNATSVNPDPIHRGVFIAERMTCAHIAAPPADVPPLPDHEGRTNRQLVEEHTQNPDAVCVSCHGTIINPLGFPFESFDAIGQYRTEDNGQLVDTSSEALVGAERVAVADALGLIDALADSPEAHECYAKHWVEFAYGRPETDEDEGLIARLSQSSQAASSIKDTIVRLVTSQAFLSRSAEELP